MKTPVKAFLCLVAACSPLLASDAVLVTDPKDLQLIDAAESFRYVTSQFEQRRDLLSTVRRAAGRKIAKSWGFEEPPDQSKLAVGLVADKSSGTLELAAVLTGEKLDANKLRAKLLEKYGEHHKRHQRTLVPVEKSIAGQRAIVVPWVEGAGEYVLVPMGRAIVLGSTKPGHYDLVERTLQVVLDPSQRSAEPPASVRVTDQGSLSTEERRSARESLVKTVTGKVQKFRGEFAKLYESLDSQEFDPNEFKSRSEKITDLYLKHTGWAVDVQYTRGPSPGTDAFRATYQVQLPTAEEAQELKELLLEKLLFYKENAAASAGALAVDAIALDAQGPMLVIRADSDSSAGTYNFIYAYVAYLLGTSQADSFLGLQ